MSALYSAFLSPSAFFLFNSFSWSIFWRYSFSCLLFSHCMACSMFISSLSLCTNSTSYAKASFSSLRFLSFSSLSCLSRLSFSCWIFSRIAWAFSCSRCPRSFTCSDCNYSYNRLSSFSAPARAYFSLHYLSNSCLISLRLSYSLEIAYFCSS